MMVMPVTVIPPMIEVTVRVPIMAMMRMTPVVIACKRRRRAGQG